MALETTGKIQSLLKNYDSTKWAKDSNVELSLKNSAPEESGKAPQSFSELFNDSILEVNNLQKQANKAIQTLVTGKSKNIHDTMLAVEKADIAFRTMNQIRQKVIDAYKEIMKMQV